MKKSSITFFWYFCFFVSAILFVDLMIRGYVFDDFSSYFIIFFVSFALLALSPLFREHLKKLLDPWLFLIIFVGMLLRLRWGLYNFAHFNYHGPIFIKQIINYICPFSFFGFTYNIFWHPFSAVFGFEIEPFFRLNLILSIISSLLFFLYLKKVMTRAISPYIGLIAFIFAPQQVVFSASESHLNLMIFYFALILLAFSLRECPFILMAMPFILAMGAFIRPETLVFPLVFAFIIFIFHYFQRGNIFNRDLLLFMAMLFFLTSPVYMKIAKIEYLQDNGIGIDYLNNFFKEVSHLPVNKAGALIKFSPHYTHPVILIFSVLGFFGSFFDKSTFFLLSPVYLLFLTQLPAYIFRLPNWHQGIYYQQSLDLFLIIFITVFVDKLYKSEKLAPLLKKSFFSLLIFAIFFNFYYSRDAYNCLYDEQIEYDFIRENTAILPDIVTIIAPRSKSLYAGIDDSPNELFSNIHPDYFQSYKGKLCLNRMDIDELNIVNLIEIASESEIDSLFLYRGIMLDDRDFLGICQNNQVETVKEKSFIFKNRMPTLIPDNSTVTIGFYRIISDK